MTSSLVFISNLVFIQNVKFLLHLINSIIEFYIEQIKTEFAKVMGNVELPQEVKTKFSEVWCARLLAYAKKFAPKYGCILKGTQEAIDAGCLDEGKLYIILGETVSLKMLSLKKH